MTLSHYTSFQAHCSCNFSIRDHQKNCMELKKKLLGDSAKIFSLKLKLGKKHLIFLL